MADTKTYKPGLLLACKLLRKFIVKWKVKLEASLGAEGYSLLLVLLDAVEAMIIFLVEDAPSPDP